MINQYIIYMESSKYYRTQKTGATTPGQEVSHLPALWTIFFYYPPAYYNNSWNTLTLVGIFEFLPCFISAFHIPLLNVYDVGRLIKGLTSRKSIGTNTLDSVPDHHSPKEMQPTNIPKLLYHQPDQSSKWGHAKNSPELTEATSWGDHQRWTGRLQSRKEYNWANARS